jgi:CheY-specific phosphatase CheX
LTASNQSEQERDDIISAVNQATETVFSTMLAMTVQPQPALDRPDPELLDGVVGLLGFTGGWAGTGMLFCEDHFACRIGSAMLMHECKEVNSDVLDGIGEMANMILGNFKEAMEGRTGPLSLSVPMVVYGKNFSTRTPLQMPWIVVPFRIGEDVFQVRVCMKPK